MFTRATRGLMKIIKGIETVVQTDFGRENGKSWSTGKAPASLAAPPARPPITGDTGTKKPRDMSAASCRFPRETNPGHPNEGTTGKE